jgi:hypothetical protein
VRAKIAGVMNLHRPIAPAMNDPAMTKTKSDRTRRMLNWAVLAVLLAFAAALYVGVIVKIAKFGY